jgi:hypothetical protein
MSRSICDNIEKDCLVADAAPNTTHTRTHCKAVPFADLEPSELDDQPVDRPVDRLTLLLFNTLKVL